MIINPIGADVTVLADPQEVPDLGHVPVNAFVLRSRQPVVIDTGLSLPDRDFLSSLSEVIDPEEVRWIWLTHPDRDHTGGLSALLAAAPHARVVTTFLGVGIMSLADPLPMDRVHLVNPGQRLDVGDRTLRAFRPPLYDNPATTGFLDERTGYCFSSDCLGAPLATAELATSTDVAVVPAAELRDRQLLWASVDSPWVQHATGPSYQDAVRAMQALAPTRIFSSHLPPVHGAGDVHFDMMVAAAGCAPFQGPDQAALEQMLRSFEPASTGTAAAVPPVATG